MDGLDRDILRILQSDGQANFRTIAGRCKTTVGTVRNRTQKLRDDGIIRRMIPDQDTKKLGSRVPALIQFQSRADTSRKSKTNGATTSRSAASTT